MRNNFRLVVDRGRIRPEVLTQYEIAVMRRLYRARRIAVATWIAMALVAGVLIWSML